MKTIIDHFATVIGLALAVTLLGCQGQPNPTANKSNDQSTTPEPIEPAAIEPAPAAKDRRLQIAENAKEALFKALSGRLMETIQAEGPVAAINVCSQEAAGIAETVGKEQGVQIGRTSFKLRNPDNAPREWVKPFVEQRVETRQHLQLDDGNLGVLFPIRLDVKCLMCHGGPDDILDSVKPELAKRYPDDNATGFKQGDLRGWFWVEVPAQNKN
ncbi:MAG: DUF3365 domain-containing protein [Planctomycetales bacterium]|nr:DUF3365 domain-containing protein [Planctomycetales bacterium]